MLLLHGAANPYYAQGGVEPDPAVKIFGNVYGDNFTGGGTIQINIGNHVQLGNRDTELRVYTPAGRLVRVLQVEYGTNRYENFLPTVYIVGGKKLQLQ